MTAIIRDAVSPDLRTTLRALKLGQMLDTLPERLTLARQQKMPHADFLELVLADEVTRREAKSASLRARGAGLDASMRLDTWDASAAVRYDHQLWNELTPLRFLDGPHGAVILGPVGVGKTHLACALGHIAIRRRRTVPMASAGKLFKQLKAARLDNTLDYEMRRLAAVELLILDDFALQPLDTTQTADFYQICVERHQRASTVVASNRTAEEWLSMMTDPLLAQSAVDRLISTAHELVIEGKSYRRRQKPTINHATGVAVDENKGDHHDHSRPKVVPSSWQHPGPITLASDIYCLRQRDHGPRRYTARYARDSRHINWPDPPPRAVRMPVTGRTDASPEPGHTDASGHVPVCRNLGASSVAMVRPVKLAN